MKKLHWYYKFLIVLILLFSMFFLINKNMSKIVNSSPYKSFISYISIPFNFIDKYNIFKYKSVLEENDYLRKKVLITNFDIDMYNNLQEEVTRLKDSLYLKDTYTNTNQVLSKVIIRNKMYFYSTLTINKGTTSGIKKDSLVVTSSGLIGRISSVSKNTSTVKLITSNSQDNKISVMIKNNNKTYIGNIIGYNAPYIKAELSSSYEGIKEGNTVYTSGLGNTYRNIYVGEITKLEKDSYDARYIMYIKPKQDMNDITYVLVLGDEQ